MGIIMKKGKKYDKGKLDWSLLPMDSIEKIVDILDFGKSKYGRDNWQALEDFDNRYYSALMRHLKAWRCGEPIDKESKRHHLSHAGCNIVFLIWNSIKKKEQ